MKRLLLLTAAVLCVASLAFGQAGSLGLYADTGGTMCWLPPMPPTPGVSAFYVVHTGTGGATASEFSCIQPACYVASFLSWAANFPVATGNPVIDNPPTVNAGASVAYGACLTGPILVGTVSYFGTSATQCCEYPVEAHKGTGLLSYTDCGTPFPTKAPVGGSTSYVNGDNTCPCGVTPTQNSTWGGIKSLYGE